MGRRPKPKTDADQWLQKIDRAKDVKKKWRDDFRIALAYEYWEGRQRPAHIPGHEWITINMVYSNLMAELPTLYSTDPYFYVKVKKSYRPNPMDVALMELKAAVRQSMLNYLKGELSLKSKARLSILDAYFQYGVAKIHYTQDRVKILITARRCWMMKPDIQCWMKPALPYWSPSFCQPMKPIV